ncbi:MAG: hypothetical protein JJ964_10590 [Rhizobiales bacterium]|nr:hypothetical protein [Hyphomicrobiales bacterium]
MENLGKICHIFNFASAFNGVSKLFIKLTLLIGLTFSLGACGTDDVVLEGALFEAAGIAGSLTKKQATPKVKERSGLVLPPAAHLPEPGKRAVVQQEDQNWPDDPDIRRKRIASQTEAARKKYCSEVGRNRQDPDYDEEKADKCGSFISKALNGFGRAPEGQEE